MGEEPGAAAPFSVVGIGASAGGQEAFEEFTLPRPEEGPGMREQRFHDRLPLPHPGPWGY
ncbi:MAG: hypothetical protein PHZ14_03805 [Sulfuricella sp.]|nr:hypothetical protein [Sulfuricella sp.]